MEEPVAGFVPNVPTMPEGHPDAAKVTAELKPFTGLTVTADVPLDPAWTEAAVAPSVKFGATIVVESVVLALADPPPDIDAALT